FPLSHFILPPPPITTLFPYTTLFRSLQNLLFNLRNPDPQSGRTSRFRPQIIHASHHRNSTNCLPVQALIIIHKTAQVIRRSNLIDRKSTRLNSSHVKISYAVFCLKNK